MMTGTFYCSELSRASDEKTFGTASVGDVWLLVEYPSAWGAKAFEESTLAAPVKAYLTGLLKSIPRARLLFIKQSRSCEGALRFFVVRCRERGAVVVKFEIDAYEELLTLDLAGVALGRTQGGGEVTGEPLFLVCTHGRRDKCCAKFGNPLYKFLREEVGESVWQSSHVGGDRFAANLVCFPEGLFYAHVTGESGRRIVSEYGGRRIALDSYRGRACYSYPVQAAEYFIRAESGLTGLEELRQLDCARVELNGWRVRFVAAGDGRIHEARVKSRMSEFQNFVTCHSSEQKSVVQYLLEDYRVGIDSAVGAR